MKRFLSILTLALLFTGAAQAGHFHAAPVGGVTGEYLVLLAPGVAVQSGVPANRPSVSAASHALAASFSGRVTEVWEDAVQGFVVQLTEERARALAAHPWVTAVEQNFITPMPVSDTPPDCREQVSYPTNPALGAFVPPALQSIPCANPYSSACTANWGLDRADQRALPLNGLYTLDGDATGVHVYVLDGGVSASHQDFLAGRVTAGADAATDPPTPGIPSDCFSHGHGTHVAGIIGARTYGVAKNVTLHPVRATLDCPANGQPSTSPQVYVRALNWIVQDYQARAKPPAVINWSGGNVAEYVGNVTLANAVAGAIAAGIPLVQAAGNQTNASISSLRDACDLTFKGVGGVPQVIVAGGTDESDGRWNMTTSDPGYFTYCQTGTGTGDCGSNIGACVDIWAPASRIASTSKQGNSQYCQLSGTSMAAPHVTGAIALYLQNHPYASIAEITNALRAQGTWNVLNTTAGNVHRLGTGSDNVLLYSRVAATSEIVPVASFTLRCAGHACTFDGSASTGSHALQYAWDFGDGAASSGASASHTYAEGPSSVRIHLTVTDTVTGKTDHSSQVAALPNGVLPFAAFTSTCTLLSCTFNGSGSGPGNAGGTITGYAWDFGDGVTQSGGSATVAHGYAAAGTYTVSLVVTDSHGNTGTAAATLAVTSSPPPVPSFTFTCSGFTCSGDASASSAGSGTITSYSWSFGDTGTATGATVVHTFSGTAVYPVALTVTNSLGLQASFQSNVAVAQDNFIVQGRACIGPNCHVGDASQTLVLRDPNLRVLFSDPASGSSPHHDWQLEINDFVGAGERFSIADVTAGTVPFTLQGGAPSHSLDVAANGNLGLGTAVPAQDVHVVSGASPTVRLDQDTTGGHPAQKWEVGGDEVSWFVRDATGGTQPLRVRPAAPASSLDLAASGKVGMGTDTPSRSLDIRRAGVVDLGLWNTAGTPVRWFVQTDNDAAHTFKISREGGGGPVWTMNARQDALGVTLKIDGSIQASNVIYTSSRELKTGFMALDGREVLAQLDRLPIAEWQFRAEEKPIRHIGPMAEDFQQVFAVFGIGPDAAHISATDANGIAFAALQGLRAQLVDEDREIAQLEATIATLERLLAAREAGGAKEVADAP